MTILAVEAQPDDWDDYIGRFPSSGPFHTRSWTECFRSERLTPVYLRLSSGDRLIGGIAGVIVDPTLPLLSRIDRRVTFFSGPALATTNGSLVRECMLHLASHARQRGLTSLISSARDYPYAYDWGASKVHLQVMHEYIVDLAGAWEHIVARMRSSISEQARKAERAGLTFHEHADGSAHPHLMRLLESTRTRRKQKSGVEFSPYYLPHLDERALSRLSRSSIARHFVARRGEDVLCALLVFAFQKRAYALLIGCSEEGYRLRAPAFVWLNAFAALRRSGVESLNLAGAGPASKLAFAKTSLGAERRACFGSVSPYLQGTVRNVLFQACRWFDDVATREGHAATRHSHA